MYIHIYISIYLSSMRKPILLEIQFEFELVETTTKNHNKQKTKTQKKQCFGGLPRDYLDLAMFRLAWRHFFDV